MSIVINNYNYDRFLAVAIDSALNQSYPAVEVVVVDDGSSDCSRDILERGYRDRVTVILQENQGQAKAVNAGFAASRGDIVIFLDSDDVLLPHAVATVMTYLKPGLSKIHFKLRAIDGSGTPLPVLIPRASLHEGDVKKLLLTHGHYLTPPTSGNAFMRGALAEVMPIPDSWPSRKAADAYLLNTVPFHGAVAACHETLGLYRIHATNHSSQVRGSDGESLATMEIFLREELAIRDLILSRAAFLGLRASSITVIESCSFLKTRLALQKLGGTVEGLPYQPVWRTMLKLIRASWISPGMDLLSRSGLTLWAFAAGVAPDFALRDILRIGLCPGDRPNWMNKIIVKFSHRRAARAVISAAAAQL